MSQAPSGAPRDKTLRVRMGRLLAAVLADEEHRRNPLRTSRSATIGSRSSSATSRLPSRFESEGVDQARPRGRVNTAKGSGKHGQGVGQTWPRGRPWMAEGSLDPSAMFEPPLSHHWTFRDVTPGRVALHGYDRQGHGNALGQNLGLSTHVRDKNASPTLLSRRRHPRLTYRRLQRNQPAISRSIAAAAATGSSAAKIGRPTTRCVAPSRTASAGVATRFWSPTALPAGRTPGVTKSVPG